MTDAATSGTPVRIRRALLSVSDKTGLVDQARNLAERGVELVSTGGTSMIDEAGKVVIMVCMFVGRVGPLTLFLFLSSRSDFEPPERYAEEPVPIG